MPILKRMEARQYRLLQLELLRSKADKTANMEESRNIDTRIRVVLNLQRRDFNRLDTHREGLHLDVLKAIDTWGDTIDQAEENQASVEATG
jgi:hypothetical protein